jgi:hypothetical protein
MEFLCTRRPLAHPNLEQIEAAQEAAARYPG